MKLALIGGGMVGQCFGQALVQSGFSLCGVVDTKPAPALREWAQALGAGVYPEAGPWLAEADVVLSAVFGSVALEVARPALQHLRAGALYVDMTTANPADMVLAGQAAALRGVDFVDVAITGAVDMHRAKTPLLCSGVRAEDVAGIFRRIDTPIQVVGEAPGQATSLKLLRSAFTKGFEALTVESLAAAEKQGLRSQLHEILSDMDRTPLKSLMESIVRTHIEHAGRRRSEVVEATRQMRAAGIEPLVLPAAQALFERTLNRSAQTPYTGSGVDPALHWLVQTAETAAPLP